MKTNQWLAGILLAISVGVPLGALAQPATKLVDGLDDDAIGIMWCSAVLFEESYWYEEGDAWSVYYDEVSYALELMARDIMEAEGWSQERQDALWETYDGAAFDLAETEDGTFLDLVGVCEDDFGHLAARPKK
ncbi:hypothetical protein [Pelagibacterium halotolerans]|uniref:hypothetical protein n=1 Tax=Pelagibacterium halotolerans TaxID=531813 RepID=UPI00384C1D08